MIEAVQERRMPRFVLECPQCDTRFNLKKYVPDHRVRCRKCRAIVKIPVIAEYLTPEERAKFLVTEKGLTPELQAKLVARYSLKRLLLVAASMVVALAGAVGLLVWKATSRAETVRRKAAEAAVPTFQSLDDSREIHLLPIGKAAEWTYLAGDRTEERRVVGSALSGDRCPQFDVAVTGPGGAYRETLRYGADGVYLTEVVRGGDRLSVQPPLLIARMPLLADDAWEAACEVRQQGGWSQAWKLTFKTALDTVDVPAGKFQCVRVTVSGKRGPDEVNEQSWYSPGKGLVRRLVQRGGKVEETRLSRFSIK